MTTKLIISIGLLALGIAANAESYFCKGEASGGVKYDGGKWVGTSFNTEDNIYIVTRSSTFKWVVKQPGSDSPVAFCNEGFRSGEMICRKSSFFRFDLNARHMRFMAIFQFGYIEAGGMGLTPSITVGKCTTID